MAKSYYAILGVSSDSTYEEIKSAYRRLSKEFHPDRSGGKSELFLQIQEAYSVLSDPQRRAQYEQSLQVRREEGGSAVRGGAFYSPPEPLIPEEGPVDLGAFSPVRSLETFRPSFDDIFDWLWRNFSSLGPPKPRRVEQLTLEIPITREQARRGGNARVMVPAGAVCTTCRGLGSVGPYECVRCAGEGSITGEVPVSISFPPGITGPHAVSVPLGRFGMRNLHLVVVFQPTDIL